MIYNISYILWLINFEWFQGKPALHFERTMKCWLHSHQLLLQFVHYWIFSLVGRKLVKWNLFLRFKVGQSEWTWVLTSRDNLMFWQNVKNVTFQMMHPKYSNFKLCKKTLKNVSLLISDIRRTDTWVGTLSRTGLGSLTHVLRRSILVLWSIKVVLLSFTRSKQLFFIGQNKHKSIGRLNWLKNVIMIILRLVIIWMDSWHMNSVNRHSSAQWNNDKILKSILQ